MLAIDPLLIRALLSSLNFEILTVPPSPPALSEEKYNHSDCVASFQAKLGCVVVEVLELIGFGKRSGADHFPSANFF